MKFENTAVFNFPGAFRGMRNPKDSWDRSDSEYEIPWNVSGENANGFVIGPNDLDLAQRLIVAGPEHRKFLRQIFVSVDITGALFWLKEYDTYKVGTTSNSCSTMHKLASYPITLDCFEIDDYDESIIDASPIIDALESLRQKFIETKDKRYWKELVRWLPSGWLQKRTFTLTYENVRSMVHQRKGHKLSEWHQFIDWAHTLPYANELIFYDGKEEKKDD